MRDVAEGDPAAAALTELLAALAAEGYAFVTPTPATHSRVLAHPGMDRARTLRDVFGWSLPFEPSVVPPAILSLMEQAGVLTRRGPLRSTVRASTLDRLLLAHSAYPTDDEDAVFFGPDSYRFAAFVRRELRAGPPPRRLVDIGAGAGAGALAAGLDWPAAELTLIDVNPKALRLARINAAAGGMTVRTVEGEDLSAAGGPFDAAIANPPYIVDRDERAYRDGGGQRGGEVALTMAKDALACLTPGGRLLLYTGAAMVAGRDDVRAGLEDLAQETGATLRYEELDPDVFGEELEGPDYRDVERIAAVGAVLIKP